jgi:hypothetical protein
LFENWGSTELELLFSKLVPEQLFARVRLKFLYLYIYSHRLLKFFFKYRHVYNKTQEFILEIKHDTKKCINKRIVELPANQIYVYCVSNIQECIQPIEKFDSSYMSNSIIEKLKFQLFKSSTIPLFGKSQEGYEVRVRGYLWEVHVKAHKTE